MSNAIIKRQKKEKELIIENLEQMPIIQIACNKSGIGRATFYRWKAHDQQFAKDADKAYEEGVCLINDIAESQLLSAMKEGNLTAVLYWLNHRNTNYSNKIEITTNQKDEPNLTKEQKELMKKAFALSGLISPKNKI